MLVQLEHVTQMIRKKVVLKNVSLTFDSQWVYGLQGINGSGKTMLMRTICGLIVPDKGRILINNMELHKDMDFPPSIGVLIESPAFLNELTGFDNLKLIASLQNKVSDEEIRDALRKVGLDPHDRRTYRKYSLGMKQRLGIACAVMGQPQIVLLDEPLNAIDADGIVLVRNIIQELKESGSLVILACHDKEELYSLSDVIIELKEGKVCGRKTLSEAAGC